MPTALLLLPFAAIRFAFADEPSPSGSTPKAFDSTANFFRVWDDVAYETESIYESPPDSPVESDMPNALPEDDTEPLDLQSLCHQFHNEMVDTVNNINRQTGNKYDFSPPPSPPHYGSDPEDLEDPPVEGVDVPKKGKPTLGSLLKTAVPYIIGFLLLNGSFVYFSATPQGVVFLMMLLSMMGMVLMPVLYLLRNYPAVLDYVMRGE